MSLRHPGHGSSHCRHSYLCHIAWRTYISWQGIHTCDMAGRACVFDMAGRACVFDMAGRACTCTDRECLVCDAIGSMANHGSHLDFARSHERHELIPDDTHT